MAEQLTPSTLELLRWVSSRPRTYAEAIEAWRTHCPRLSIWDDALIDGLVQVTRANGATTEAHVIVTDRGRAALAASP